MSQFHWYKVFGINERPNIKLHWKYQRVMREKEQHQIVVPHQLDVKPSQTQNESAKATKEPSRRTLNAMKHFI